MSDILNTHTTSQEGSRQFDFRVLSTELSTSARRVSHSQTYATYAWTPRHTHMSPTPHPSPLTKKRRAASLHTGSAPDESMHCCSVLTIYREHARGDHGLPATGLSFLALITPHHRAIGAAREWQHLALQQRELRETGCCRTHLPDQPAATGVKPASYEARFVIPASSSPRLHAPQMASSMSARCAPYKLR